MKKVFLTALTLAVTLSSLSTPALAAKAPPPALTTITTDQNAETFTNSDPNRLVLGDGFGGQGRVIFDYATGELTFDHCNLDKMLGYHEVTRSGLRVTSCSTVNDSSSSSLSLQSSAGSNRTYVSMVNTGIRDNVPMTVSSNPVTINYDSGDGGLKLRWKFNWGSGGDPQELTTAPRCAPLFNWILQQNCAVSGGITKCYICGAANVWGSNPETILSQMWPNWLQMDHSTTYSENVIMFPIMQDGRLADSLPYTQRLGRHTLNSTYAMDTANSGIIGYIRDKPYTYSTGIKAIAPGYTRYTTESVFNTREVLNTSSTITTSRTESQHIRCGSVRREYSSRSMRGICSCHQSTSSDTGIFGTAQYDFNPGDTVSATERQRVTPFTITQTVSQTGTRQVAYNPIVPFADTRDSTIKSVVFKGCASTISFPRTDTKTVSGYTDTANIWGWMNDVPVTIEGGKYETVNLPAALVTSGNFNSASKFITDGDSTSETANGRTTVKLTNPPIIIDWGEFPGLDIDLSAPTIEVLRNPVDTRTPCTQVTLTINCKDPNGKDDPKPLSINGGAFVATPATFTATENQQVSIMAKDANGNVREYIATIANIDADPPEIQGFTQSNDVWTKDPITVTVKATDDTKLHSTAPYMWEFTPNSTGNAGKTTSVWVATKTFRVTENGTVRCQVKDAMDKTTWSEPYPVKCIDKIAPAVTATLNPPAGSEGSKTVGVTVSLAINDLADTVTFESSGLSSKPIKWSSTEAWSADTERVFHENGTYNIQVRDAVGNISNPIPITVNNISTSGPVIQEFTGTHLNKDFVKAPVTLTVKGIVSEGKTLPPKPYSWDGGKTWTSVNTQKVMENGEYTVKLRDAVGNIVESSLVVNNIDPVKPTASVYLFKGPPADGSSSAPADYVWKLRVEADDVGSGVDTIETLWDSGTHTTLPIIQDIVTPGIYGIIVRDKAGNETYAEKIVTYESLGESAGGGGAGSNQYVDVEVPSTGSAGSYFNAALGDLVYGKTGAYNVSTSTFKAYASGSEGITINFLASGKSGNWLTGDVTFNGVKHPVKFSGAEGVASGKKIEASCFIPVAGLTTDAKNARIKVVMHEYKDSTKATLVKEGSATLYTSVQVSKPAITYTYSKITDMMTVVGTSSVAGLKANGLAYQLGGGSSTTYTVPFKVNGATTVKLVAEDCVGGRTEMTLNGNDLQLNGSGGGSLPTEGIKEGNNVNSYRTSNRAAETYIIGGSQSNTDQVPDASVFNQLLGS